MKKLESKLKRMKEQSIAKFETFHVRVQKALRLQVPRVLRWKYKLEAGMVFRVQVEKVDTCKSHTYLTRLQRSGRISIPKIAAEIIELKPGDLVRVAVWLLKV